jgi:hypothetical protein
VIVTTTTKAAAATTSSSAAAAAAPPIVSNSACKSQEITLLTNFYILKDFPFRRLSGFITPMNNPMLVYTMGLYI